MYLSKYKTGHQICAPKKSMKKQSFFPRPVSRTFSLNPRPKGSITVEAALVLPILIFTLLSFFYYFAQIRFEMVMQASFTNAGTTAALVYGIEEQGEETLDEFAGTEISALLSGTGAKLVKGVALSSYIYTTNASAISPFITVTTGGGGIKNFSLLASAYDSEKSSGTMSVRYRFTLPWVGKAFSGQISLQSGYFHAWVGRSMQDAVTYVYMTPNGSVYHLSLECTYLTKRIQSVSLSTAKTTKNAYGVYYTACSICCQSGVSTGSTVYITTYGTKYHCDVNCTAITHDIKKITLEEAQESYPLCSKCEKESSAGE